MTLRIEVRPRTDDDDLTAARVRHALSALDLDEVDAVRTCALYFLRGPIEHDDAAIERLVAELLVDPVTQAATWHRLDEGEATARPRRLAHVIEVSARPGITDTEAANLRDAARDHGFGVDDAATGMRYELFGQRRARRPGHAARVERLATTLLANEVVQVFTIDTPVPPPFVPVHEASAEVERFALDTLDDEALVALSMQRRLALDLAEMRAIRHHFAETLGRAATDVELEMIAQTWSEHCAHKTFEAHIELHTSQPDGGDPEAIDGLLPLLRASTDALARPWVRSAFVDNAGVVELTDTLDLALKVETHNHPSALDPFGGANTGVGGVVRDILGVSARPLANLDVLCFGPPDLDGDTLPDGVLHPRRVRLGVVAGIEDYGNKMGIPTVAGAVLYDPGYATNPLVFCGCLGIAPRDSHPRRPRRGDRVVVIGGRTGRDGLRGATFSSMGLDEATAEVSGSAVQIGHPVHEKQLQEVILRARDERLYHAITDCGAGGLSSAVGEMAAALGADIELGEVSLAYDGLAPWEIWLSESQERMVLAVPDTHWPRLADLCAVHRIDICCIGRFGSDGLLTVRCGGEVVARLSADFLHGGAPRRRLVACWDAPQVAAPDGIPVPPSGLGGWLLALLGTDELGSREDIVRRFDHEVQGGTVGRPLVGPGDGPGDGAVLVPHELWRAHAADPDAPLAGVAVGLGIQPWIGEVDPYAMAWAVVDEALRNVVAVGADPDRVALLDNFCWGDAREPHALGALVRCVQGCHDAALAYGTPFVSGKDSLNNVYADADGYTSTIPGTLLVTAVGRVPDVRRRTASALTTAGNALYLLGSTREELGGSSLARHLGLSRDDVARPASVTGSIGTMRALHRAIADGLVAACHDVSGGGLAVALAEMAIGGRLGARLELGAVDADAVAATNAGDAVLCFSESTGRFLVEVAPEHLEAFEALMDEVSGARIGEVVAERRLTVLGQAGAAVIDVDVDVLAAAWRRRPAV